MVCSLHSATASLFQQQLRTMSRLQYGRKSVVDLLGGAPPSLDYDVVEVWMSKYKEHVERCEPNRRYSMNVKIRSRSTELSLGREADGSIALKVGWTDSFIRVKDMDNNTIFESKGNVCQIDHERIIKSDTILRGTALVAEVWIRAGGHYWGTLDPFVPQNPFQENVLSMLSSAGEEYADISFDVKGPCNYRFDSGDDEFTNSLNIHALFGTKDDDEDDDNTKTSVIIHAHLAILKACAPFLADLCEGYDKDHPVPIQSEPGIFRLMLAYIYGGRVPPSVLRDRPRAFIEIADKYEVTSLKIAAEATWVKSNSITAENFLDTFSFAESTNCDQLKETALAFLLRKSKKILESPAFDFVDLYSYADSNDYPSLKEAAEKFFIKNGKEVMSASSEKITAYPGLAPRLLSLSVGFEELSDDDKLPSLDNLRRHLHNEGLDLEGSKMTLVHRLIDHNKQSAADTSATSDTSVESDASN